jgi:hypothetical protein
MRDKKKGRLFFVVGWHDTELRVLLLLWRESTDSTGHVLERGEARSSSVARLSSTSHPGTELEN